MSVLTSLGKLSNPLNITLALLTYTLGAGIARYLGSAVGPRRLLVGLLLVALLQAATAWLGAAFRPAVEDGFDDRAGSTWAQTRRGSLSFAIGSLGAAGALAFALFALERPSTETSLFIALAVFCAVAYALPPLSAAARGFGELLLAAQIGYLAPTLGFLLQAGSAHRLPVLCGLALTCLFLATLIALQLPSYAEDIRLGRTTLMTRMGWHGALTLHHALLLATYLLLAFAVALGFSVKLIGPAFLTVPFAVLQGVMLQGIAAGARPIWRLLRASSLAVFALTAYFLAVSFWLR